MALFMSLGQHQCHNNAPYSQEPRRWYFMMSSRYPRISRLSPMRRDRGGRDGFDPFIPRYPGLDNCFSDLTIDARTRRMMDSRRPDGFDFDGQSFDRRRSDERQCPQRPDVIHDHHGLERGLAIARRGSNSLPFSRAMKELHKQLGKAEELYNRFQSEFDNDTAAVKKYASAKTLSDMWVKKVKAVRDPQTFAEGEDHMAEEEPENFGETFAEMETKVAAALQAAASSTLYRGKPSERQQARADASERLQQRANLALKHFMNLMEKAKARREDCRHLVNELQQWQILLDPETEMNKELFKLSDEEEDAAADGQPEGAAWDD